MFKYINGELPDAFDNMFLYRHEIYDYNTTYGTITHKHRPKRIALLWC